MRTLRLTLTAAGFAVSAALHLLSFTRWGAVAGERTIWALGIVALVLALAMIARLQRTGAPGRRWGRLALLDWRGMVGFVPPGLRFLIVGAALYAWLIFFFLVPLVFFRFVEPGLEAARTAGGVSHP
jgi:hypothetical protein